MSEQRDLNLAGLAFDLGAALVALAGIVAAHACWPDTPDRGPVDPASYAPPLTVASLAVVAAAVLLVGGAVARGFASRR